MIRVGIIGCGKIADQHAEQIRKIPDCRIVGACDSEILMARQLGERFGVEHHFSSAKEMLEVARPDVVHITTPPQSHHELARLCLEAGCSVYVEKPFTINATEAENLIKIADEKKSKITVGHNVQFSPASIRMRELVRDGFLGGPPVHMESVYCYDFGDIRYVKAFLGDKTHWLRSMPGALLQNIISHGICKIAEFLAGDDPRVIAHGFSSPLLQSLGESEIIDELRVIISEKSGQTAYFTFSTGINPVLHQFRLFGRQNSLIVDNDNQTLIKIKGGKYKSYLNHFVPPVDYAKQYLANSMHNVNKFIRKDFHMNYGMEHLIRVFYKSVSENAPLPIPHREILQTARIMDEIFAQIRQG